MTEGRSINSWCDEYTITEPQTGHSSIGKNFAYSAVRAGKTQAMNQEIQKRIDEGQTAERHKWGIVCYPKKKLKFVRI